MSYKFRRGTRSDEKFKSNLYSGIDRSKNLVVKLCKFTQNLFEDRIISYYLTSDLLEKKKVYKKNFRDPGDVRFVITNRDSISVSKICDIEICSSSSKETAAIKYNCIQRCQEKSWCMLIALYPQDPIMGFYLGQDFVDLMSRFEYHNTMYEYGNEEGKGGFRVTQEDHWFSLEPAPRTDAKFSLLNNELERLFDESKS